MRIAPADDHQCPPEPPVPAPPVPVPPGPARDGRGLRFGRTYGSSWWHGDAALRLAGRVGDATGYGSWGDAVAAARLLSAGTAGAVAVFDDRGRLYLHVVVSGVLCERPVHLGARHERGYAFTGDAVRGIVDGALLVSRGDCLHDRVPAPR